MSKHLSVPASRLICLGNAKFSTNAGGGEKDELDSGDKFQ